MSTSSVSQLRRQHVYSGSSGQAFNQFLRRMLFAVNHLYRKFRTTVDAQLCFLFHTGRNLTVVQCARQSIFVDFEKLGRQGAASTMALAQLRIHSYFHVTTSSRFVFSAL